ncbi:Aldo/keto reductase, partial [Decorospora gaudefroyi]
PAIGFGTWNLKESQENTTIAVAIAIEKGYRQIDCAAAYGNEQAVGKGIHKGLEKAGLKRAQIWVTSKLWNDHHASDRVEAGLNQTLQDLNLDYLDLYLMHWPVGKGPDDKKYHFDYLDTWHAMSELLKSGRVRHIGVSNFSPDQLKDLLKHSHVKPAVHQMELHPYLPQSKWVRAHQAHGIAVTAYSPLGNMNPTYGDRARRSVTTQSKAPLLLENEMIKDIAGKRDCTAAQVVLAWGMSRGTSVIPKSKHETYIKENLGAKRCGLETDDLAKIDELGEDPVRFNNPGRTWGVHLFEGLD